MIDFFNPKFAAVRTQSAHLLAVPLAKFDIHQLKSQRCQNQTSSSISLPNFQAFLSLLLIWLKTGLWVCNQNTDYDHPSKMGSPKFASFNSTSDIVDLSFRMVYKEILSHCADAPQYNKGQKGIGFQDVHLVNYTISLWTKFTQEEAPFVLE